MTLYCNCHTQIGPLQFIKDCEWEFVDGKTCPPLRYGETNYDWECNPKWSECLAGQYDQKESESIDRKLISPTRHARKKLTTAPQTTTTTLPTTEFPKTTTEEFTMEVKTTSPVYRITVPHREIFSNEELDDEDEKRLILDRDRKDKHGKYNGRLRHSNHQRLVQEVSDHSVKEHTGHLYDEIARKSHGLNSDSIETRYYTKDGDEQYFSDQMSSDSSGSPSITNIIDFRPLFTRLFDSEDASLAEIGSRTTRQDKEDLNLLRKKIRKIKNKSPRSVLPDDYPENSFPQEGPVPLQYKSSYAVKPFNNSHASSQSIDKKIEYQSKNTDSNQSKAILTKQKQGRIENNDIVKELTEKSLHLQQKVKN